MKQDARLALLAVTGAVAAGTARGAYTALRRYPPAGQPTWTRTNHRGEPVTLLEGPAVTVGAVAGLATASAIVRHQFSQRQRAFTPAAIAGLGAVTFGLLDDLRGSAKRRGLRGHLGALAHGEVTTGTVKLVGLAGTGLAAALAEGGGPADVAINAGLVAGGANLLNLFDLRPGRAVKVATLSAAAIAAGGASSPRDPAGKLAALQAVAAPTAAALALLPEDLGERAMLGDAGANALGAMLGAAAAAALPRGARAGVLAAIVALTVASEKVSFTRVIASTPPLNWLDLLGRRPAAPSGTPPAAPVAGGPLPGTPLPDNPVSDGPLPGTPVSDNPVSGRQLSDNPVSDNPVGGGPFPGNPLSDNPVSGNPVSGNPVSGGLLSGTPVSDNPVSDGLLSGNPVSGNPVSGGLLSGTPLGGNPVSGGLLSGTPVSDNPVSGGLLSGTPVSDNPVSGGLLSGTPLGGNPVSGNLLSGGPLPGDEGTAGAGSGGSADDGLAARKGPRYQPGRHRRAAAGIRGRRWGSVVSSFAKTVARRGQ